VEEAREVLGELDCDLAPTVLHERADFRTASVAAKSAQEIDPKGKAAAEMAELYLWVCQQLVTSPTQRKKGVAA